MDKRILYTLFAIACILAGGSASAAVDNVNAPLGDAGIYGGVLSVKPNVLIIFDTSGSMADEIPVAYDPSTTYSGSYVSGRVYHYVAHYYWWDIMKLFPYYTWDQFSTSTSVISCNDAAPPYNARTALETLGTWSGRINASSPYQCGSSYPSRQLATGNYLNFRASGSDTKSKLQIAKEAVNSLLDSQVDASGNETVRMGLMRFDNSNSFCGGYIVKPCGTPYYASGSAFRTAVNNLTAFGNTPLAETLAEAGLYFAGQNSWAYRNRAIPSGGDTSTSSASDYSTVSTYTSYSSSGTKTYKSPIQWRCQKNFIILVTDGMPTADDGSWYSSGGVNVFTGLSPYISTLPGKRLNRCRTTGGAPYDYDCDNAEASSSTHWLDDVASFLYNEDLRNTSSNDASGTESFNDPLNLTQNVVTYTIGFGDETDTEFLRRVAENGGAGSDGSFLALDQQALEDALSEIMSQITTRSSQFLAPVVPLNTAYGSYADNAIYFGLFRTMNNGEWRGNVKKYGFAQIEETLADGSTNKRVELYQKDGSTPALDPAQEGHVLATARSVWTNAADADGNQTDRGGVGEWMLNDAKLASPTRVFYTHNLNASGGHDPDSSLSLFSSSNPNLAGATGAANLNVTDAADCMDYIRAQGIYKPGTSGTGRTWLMGDILHSRPALLRYGNYNLLFVGANDGFLHCIVDNQNDDNSELAELSNDTVSVPWSFVPWELVGTLHEIRDDSNREYFVDNVPVLYNPISSYNADGSPNYTGDKLLTFGLRRGGSHYYTLKVGTVNASGTYTYASPTWKWWIKGSGTSPFLVGTESLGQSWSKPQLEKMKTGATTAAQGMLLAGGYDEVSQDALDPANPPTSLPTSDTKGRVVFAVNPSTGALLTNPAQPLISTSFSVVDFLAFDRNNNDAIDTIYAADLGGKVYVTRDSGENGSWSSTWSTSSTPLFNARSSGGANMVLKMFSSPDVALETTYDYVFVGTGDREHPNARAVAAGKTQTVDRFYAIKNKWGGNAHSPLTEADLVDVTDFDYSSGFDETSAHGWYIRMDDRLGEKIINRPVIFNRVVYLTTYVPPDPSATPSTDACVVSNLGEWRLYELNYKTGEAASDLNGDGAKTILDRSSVQGTGLPPQLSIAVTDKGPMLLIPTENAVKSKSLSSDRDVVRYYWRQH